MGLVRCRNCGSEISDSFRHCPHCGAARGGGATQRQSGFPWALLGVMLFCVLPLGLCVQLFDSFTDSSTSSYTASTAVSTPPAATTPSEAFYIHGPLNVRSGPGATYPVLRTLSRGDLVYLGPKDARGWAELRTAGGSVEGYVYRASDLVRSSMPTARRSPQRAYGGVDRNPTGATARCRDGTLSYSANRRGTCSHHGGVAEWY